MIHTQTIATPDPYPFSFNPLEDLYGPGFVQVARELCDRTAAACANYTKAKANPVPPPSPVAKAAYESVTENDVGHCAKFPQPAPAVEQAPSANPPETPGSSGESVNPYKAGDWCVTGWDQAADAWRTYHAAQLYAMEAASMAGEAALRGQLDTVTRERDDLRGRLDDALGTLHKVRLALSIPEKSEKGGAA